MLSSAFKRSQMLSRAGGMCPSSLPGKVTGLVTSYSFIENSIQKDFVEAGPTGCK